MFDFANSSYTTLIITVAFSIYFTKFVAAGPQADFLWGTAILITNAVVMLLSPLVGAVADDSGRKKLFLFLTYSTCVVCTAALWWALPGGIALALTLLVLSNIAFSFGENFAGAFLPEISTPSTIGRVSAIGWGVGYFGGLACLLLVRPFLGGLGLTPEELFSPQHSEALADLRFAWVLTALFFLAAGLPTFLFLRERAPRGPRRGLGGYARVGTQRLRETLASLKQLSQLSRFLVAFFFFQAGLTTVVAFAAVFAERTIGFTTDEVVQLFIALQLSAALGALAFGFLQDAIGGRRTLELTLWLWIAVCVGCFFVETKGQFWIAAMAAGLGIGSLQSAARAVVGLFAPAGKSAELFGFWGLAGKAAYMVGPFVFGIISSASGNQRVAILSTAAFFILGLLGLRTLDEAEGLAQARRWESRQAEAGSDSP